MNDLDFVTDRNPDICAFLFDAGVTPDYVLQSERVTEDSVSTLDKVAFADPDKKLYPCHTKAACWQSAAHFIGRGKEDASVMNAIEKMASYHGITEDIATLKKALAPTETMEKEASESNLKYALSLDMTGFIKEGGVENFYPINSYEEVVDSAEDATADFQAGNMPVEVMRKVASTIMSAAREFSVPSIELTPEVMSFGNDNTPDATMAMYKLASRRKLGVDTTQYQKEIEALQEKQASMHLDDFMVAAEEVANRLAELDKQAGVKYSSKVENPYALVMCGPSIRDIEKAAASTVEVLGVRVPVADLVNLKDEDLEVEFAKSASVVIKEAKACVSGNTTVEMTNQAGDMLAGLSKEASMLLLAKLADAAW